MKFIKSKGKRKRQTNIVQARLASNITDCNHTSQVASDNTNAIKPIVRPSKSMSDLAGDADLIKPYKLRSLASRCKPSCLLADNDSTKGNRVVSLDKVMVAFNMFVTQHHMASPTCEVPSMVFCPSKEKILGLCVSETIFCKECGFEMVGLKFYDEVSDGDRKGPKPGKLNIQFAVAITSTGTGVRAAQEMLAVMDIPAPSKRILQNRCNQVNDQLVKLSKEVLSDNRRKVQALMEVWDTKILCTESDVAYNNPPKGRSFYQAGTQAFCPLVENITQKKLIVAYNVANKLCKRCQLQGKGHDGHCSANYKMSEPIGNAEKTLAFQNMTDLLNDSTQLLPSTVTTDNDGKIASGMALASYQSKVGGVRKGDCTIHVTRNQRKKCCTAKWSAQFAGLAGSTRRTTFIKDLADAITKRCSGELSGCIRHINKQASEEEYLRHAGDARSTIIPCFMGNHSKCSKSFVCPRRKRQKPHVRHLPQKRYLSNLTPQDSQLLQNIIDYKLSDRMLLRQRNFSNTNKCEALHKKVFRSLPKDNTFSRNVFGRVGSQIVSASLGKAKGILKTLETTCTPLSTSGPGEKALQQLSSFDQYDSSRRRTREYKRRRKHHDLARKKLTCVKGSYYEHDHLHPNANEEHAYAVNMTKIV